MFFWKNIKTRKEAYEPMDVLVSGGNEEEMARQAEALGFKEVIFLHKELKKPSGLASYGKMAVKRGVLVQSLNEVDKAKNHYEFVFAPSRREFFENKKVNFIIDSEENPEKDSFYQRKAGLDDVLCKFAKKNNKTIVFDVKLLGNKLALGRMMQNARMCRKYKLNFLIATFASHPLEMRAKKDLDGFARMLRLI